MHLIRFRSVLLLFDDVCVSCYMPLFSDPIVPGGAGGGAHVPDGGVGEYVLSHVHIEVCKLLHG